MFEKADNPNELGPTRPVQTPLPSELVIAAAALVAIMVVMSFTLWFLAAKSQEPNQTGTEMQEAAPTALLLEELTGTQRPAPAWSGRHYRLTVRVMPWEHAETVEINASPAEAYETISQLDRMGEWSPENEGGSWIAGDGTKVGDRFEGNNRIGERTWSAVAQVVRCDPPQAFCFTVGALDNPVAEWGYHFEASETGTKVTETWKMTQLPPSLVDAPAERIQGRADMVAASMATTLANLKASFEG